MKHPKKPASRKPRSARSGTGTGKQKSGSRQQTATAYSHLSRPATISLEGTLEMDPLNAFERAVVKQIPKDSPPGLYNVDMQAVEAAYMNDVAQKAREHRIAEEELLNRVTQKSSTPPDSFHRAGSETGWITSAAATLQKAPYDPTGALENLERARNRLLDARSGHRVALVDYRTLRPTDPKFPDAAQVLYAAGLELVKAAGDLYHTVKEI